MKKEYKAPAMKVRKIECSQMLCGSIVGIYMGEKVSTSGNEYSDYSGYDEAW